MSAFSGASDLSGTIKIEGAKILLEFLPTVPQVNQGTIKWNIPSPADGCASQSSLLSAYCGIIIVASRTPLNATNIPTNGVRYTSDPSLDPDLHAGDVIGDALVIGAFYEGDKKANGEDMTTELVVNDLDSETTYYIGSYAVSCTLEYHQDGIRAYSDSYGDVKAPNTPSVSAVVMNDGEGVQLTDGTNLEAGRQYGFEFDLNTDFPNDSNEDNRITVSFDGADAPTYDDLINVVNAQLAEIDNPPRSAEPPNSGSQLWNPTTKELQTFDGTQYNSVDDVIVDTDDPSITPTGSYWFDEENQQLKQRNSNVLPVTPLWDDITTIVYDSDPSNPECNVIWFSGTTAYEWSGTAWCELQTFVQDTDPSLTKIGKCGQFWYKESTSTLNKYNVETSEWEEKLAIFWSDAPDALTSGTFWFSSTEQVLRKRIQFGNVSDWNIELNFVIGEVEPVKTPDLIWYRESTDEFFQLVGNDFVSIDVLVWHEDPSSVTSCELWWDADSDDLFEWDVVNLSWKVVAELIESETDPLNPEEIEEKSYWHDLSTNEIKEWNGSFYEVSDNYIDFPTDPTAISTGDDAAWVNSSTGEIQIPSTVAGQVWEQATPVIISEFDPEDIPVGKAWFDETNNSLKLWNGISWITVPYTTQPVKNKVDELWFDTNTNELKKWDGKAWVPATPKVTASLDARGNLRFTTRETGSCVSLLMLIPGYTFQDERQQPSPVTYGGGPAHNSGYKNVYTDNPFETPLFIDSNLREDQFLFNSLPGEVQAVVNGTDTVESVPSYAQLGVGTDGTPDERRELAHAIKIQLGFPTVDVELTDEQLDRCMNRAFDSLRKRSDIAYRRNFFLLDLRPGVQNYTLTNKKIGFNRIVNIMGAFRRSGAFSGGYSTNSVFDQLFAQQLYGSTTAGGFDMTSLHLSQQYLELIELMFATKLNFHFNESNRTLYFHQDFHKHERVLLDTTTERTEQEMFKDRWVKSWIERYSLAHARLILAEVRGKYQSLPGAGGGTSLNASDLLSTSAADFQECYQQLEDYVASNSEDFGAFDFVIG